MGDLRLRRSLTLGPKENQIVDVVCEKENSRQVLEEAISRTTDFRIIDSVCSMCKGEVWIPIVNVSDREIILSSDTKIAQAFTVQQDEVLMVGQEDDEWTNSPEMEDGTYEPRYPEEDLVEEKKGIDRLPPIEHLRERLNEQEFERLQSILSKHVEAFQKDKKDIGLTDLIEHEIELVTGAQPHKETVRRLNPEKQRQAAEQVEDLINKGVVVPSKSTWAAGIVMAKKKDPGTMRLCIDFRMLNDRTIKNGYPLPRFDDSVASLGKARFFTVLDMGSAFWQIPLRLEDQIKTAFATPKGLYHRTRMPFGLCNATATFQRLMIKVLMGIPEERANFVMCYVDDVLIASTTVEKHLDSLDEVFGRIKMAGLRCKPAKCAEGADQIFRSSGGERKNETR